MLSLLLSAGFLWLLLRGGLPLLPSSQALRSLPWVSLALYMILSGLSALVKAYRWTHLLRPVAPGLSARRITGVCMVGFSAVFFAPLRSGEIVRPYMISQGSGVSFMQAAGTVAAERVIDGLVLASLTLVAFSAATLINPLPSAVGDLPLPVAAVPAAIYSAVLIFATAFALMMLFYVARARAARATQLVVGLVSRRAADWASATLIRLADGLSFLPSRGHLLRVARDTAGYWGLALAAQWVLLRGLGLDASVAQAATTLGVLGLGSMIPAGPGMFGAYQIAGLSSLALFFPLAQLKTAGAMFVFLSYAAQLGLNGIQLLAGYWLLARSRA